MDIPYESVVQWLVCLVFIIDLIHHNTKYKPGLHISVMTETTDKMEKCTNLYSGICDVF